jgi:hypothetical protein
LIEAFWLTPVDGRGGPDWICPYQTKVPGLQPPRGRTFVRFMSEDEFLGICRPLAEERIARDGGIEKPYE